MRWPERLLAAAGAVAGLLGIALSAWAAHMTGPGSLDTAARFLLLHAPALMALAGLLAAGLFHRTAGRLAGLAWIMGLLLFSGDLAMRALLGVTAWRLAAPSGGVILMLGWALTAASAIAGPRTGGR